MKKVLFITLLSIIFNGFVSGQNVYIPDPVFKTYLVNNENINTNYDNEIQVSEAEAYEGEIFCSNLGISDLTGIEAFTSLSWLQCNGNQLTILDVSNNTNLRMLGCMNNQLNSLILGNNPNLNQLGCSNNLITSLDVSNIPALEFLQVNNNLLTEIDLSDNLALEYLNIQNNHLTDLDVSNNPALIQLAIYNNQLTSLDVTNNPALYFLSIENNEISTLDVSNNTELFVLYLGYNNFTSLDVTSNPALEYLACEHNLISELDLSQNQVLQYLYCNDNQLTSLNVKNGNNINFQIWEDSYSFDATNNPNLTCIQVDDAEWSTANWSSGIDPTASFSEDCELGTEDVVTNNFSVYPNPVNNILNIKGNIIFSHYQLANTLGQIVGRGHITNNQIDLGKFTKGKYILILFTENGEKESTPVIIK